MDPVNDVSLQFVMASGSPLNAGPSKVAMVIIKETILIG